MFLLYKACAPGTATVAEKTYKELWILANEAMVIHKQASTLLVVKIRSK
jgi:hypothetical protein